MTSEDLEDIEDLFNVAEYTEMIRLELVIENPRKAKRQKPNLPRVIESFDVIDVGNLFRFRSHQDLWRLLNAWQLPIGANGKVCLSNRRHSMYVEELLLFCLKRPSSKNTLDEISRGDFTSCDYSRLSRGFSFFIDYTKRTFKEKLSNKCLTFFEPRFSMYAEAIRKKCNLKGGTQFVEIEFFVCGFIDCNNTGVARAGAGPLHPGQDAPRRDPGGNIQEAIYNGTIQFILYFFVEIGTSKLYEHLRFCISHLRSTLTTHEYPINARTVHTQTQ